MRPCRPAAVAAALLAAGCGGHQAAAGPVAPERPNTLTAAESKAGWRLLFDGSTTRGWRAYNADSMPTGWRVVDGALTRVAPAGDIITTDTYRNFELSVDWNISPGGNSGIFYHGALGSDAIYYSAPEMQVLDDARHPDGQSPLTSAGADYGLYPAPRGVVKPAGEWNTAKVVARGNHIEHWLNGRKIVSYEMGSADWAARVAKSKFNQWPQYGKAAVGYIGLQDHGDRVAFRNIKIRLLP